MKNLLSISLIAIVLLFSVGACDEDGDVIPKEDYTPFTLNFELYADTVDLLAGQDMDIGEVQIWHDLDNMYVTYIVDKEGWCLEETHLHVAESEEDIPQNNSGNPIPGQFKYTKGHDCLTEYTETLDDYDLICDDSLVVAAHADVVKKENGDVIEEETAWGSGERITDQGNWATYFAIQCMSEWPASGTVSVAYEDLPQDDNDWDYNDFVVDIDVKAMFAGDPNDPYLTGMIFTVRPETKTASYTHSMHLSNKDFDCSGNFKLYRDGNLEEEGNFIDSLDVELIENTGNYPETVSLEIAFTSVNGFSLYKWEEDQYHGENLFFDPYLYVKKTGEEIHTADVRMLTVPIDWEWPTPDETPIWEEYSKVEEGNPPEFQPEWWN